MGLSELLQKTVELNGSDLFIIPGSAPMAKAQGRLVPLSDERILPETSEKLVRESYAFSKVRSMEMLEQRGDDDFSFSIASLARFRCNVYRQRGTLAANYRVVTFGLPEPEKLHIPELVMAQARHLSGMILVTGPAGSGKSTTMACLLDRINSTRSGHIITIEDPIEFLHNHKKSLVSQREVPNDTASFARALRCALRQAPDVVMLGEMRDSETVSTAITAAETGHLVISSLHTVGTAKTVDRILDTYPANQQQQIRVQLSMVLRAVISQKLLPLADGSQMPVFEVMTITPAVQNMIRDGKTFQIDNAIYSGSMAKGGDMISMDNELLRLYQMKKISRETALMYAVNADSLSKRLL